jgi:uncharacterized protein YhfF
VRGWHIVDESPAVQEFWRAFLRSGVVDLPEGATYFEASMFGEGGELAAVCAAAVLAGEKTTTSGLLWGWEAEGLRLPEPGEYSVVLNADGVPVCVTETVEATIRAFNEVDEQFAYDYGEGERTLEWWRKALWNYYAADCARNGWEPSPEMPLVCQRFRVVYQP